MSKQTKFKRMMSIALVAALALGSAPISALSGFSLPSFGSFFASAADEEIVWTVATEDMLVIEGNTIKGYTDKLSGNIEIPTHINGTAITAIEDNAFKGCLTLTAVKINDNISEIGWYAFQKCDNLKKVYFNSNSCTMTNASYAPFANNVNFTEIVFGENVTAISANVCYNATNLQTVIFEGEVTSIGNGAFANCSSLKSVDLSKVKSIGNRAFENCSSVPSFDFSEDLETIGDNAFIGCKITEITIPAKVKSIGWYAFQQCDNLKKVYFNSNSCTMTNASYAPFANNVNFTEIVFGENVTAISANVCYNATHLQTVTFEGKVTTINKNAFTNCTSLSDVYYNAGSQADWDKVTIATGNDILTSDDVTVHYGVYPVSKDNAEFGVEVTYTNKCFDEEVNLKVEETDGERTPGAVYLSDGEIKTQVGCFEIKMVSADGTTAQPKDGYKVTVKMAIPAEYVGKKNFRIVHRLANGGRENFSTSPKGNELKLTVKGNYLEFEVSSFSEFEVSTFEKIDATVKIKNNSRNRTINYGETLKLTALAEKTDNLPEDVKICWYVDGVLKGEGETYEFRKESGNAEITVKLVDGEDNVLVNAKGEEISDSQNVTVKAGFFQKLISFFKNLFGINRIIEQAFGFKLIVE
ncbi:MAG: leucine-rich repeat domain-containing protein [Clostridia bacterium]|nr:leucine-rich repeat domain-containing protein [Clostridia bacterium]